MSCPVEGSMSNDVRVVAAEAVGECVAELDIVVVFPVIVAVGGGDGETDVDARRRVLRHGSAVVTRLEHRIGREDGVIRREQDSQK